MMLRRRLADRLVTRGNRAADGGDGDRARRQYLRASRVDATWSVPWYNLGIQAKYAGEWAESLRCNRQATQLAPDDKAAWWNLGIAATALHDWTEARRVWRHLGIDLPEGEGEVAGPGMSACARLNAFSGEGEVVWGERIDPARILILNIPLPESGHRFRDIVVSDGAVNGQRSADGEDVPVFDELCLWQASAFGTYQVALRVPDGSAESALMDLCNEREVGIEDWSTIKWICTECSKGDPGAHECKSDRVTDGAEKRYALATRTEASAQKVLDEWCRTVAGAAYSELELLVLPARSN